MPTLNWIGKEAVVNHHHQVPFHLLKDVPELACGEPGDGNLIVQGDNLVALKALLPYYAGQVKCIYIDPPYNTGEQTWTYNDKVNSPTINVWLGKTVGKEADDLARHDKWLCMMYSRLQLLLKFLSDDGFLFISIDDVELYRLKLIMDELLPPDRHLATFVWKSRRNLDSRHQANISVDHEYVLAYRGPNARLRGATKDMDKYANPDNDPRGSWMSDNLIGLATKDRRPNLHYDLINPETGINYGCPKKGWRYSPETMAKKITEGRVIWPKSAGGRPRHKKFSEELNSEFAGFSSLVQCGNTNEGTEEVSNILGIPAFIFPKPRTLVEALIEQATDKDSLVLDSFAGSGTTGHAVLNLNKADGGNRKFILVEMEPKIAKEITAERVRRVAHGYTNAKGEPVEGLGGGFRFCELGEPLFDETGKIRESVRFAELARHVYFTETGEPLPRERVSKSPLIGVCRGVAVYLLYNGILGDKSANGGNVLTRAVLAELPPFDGPRVIYCAGCLLGKDRLNAERITVRQTPYEIKVS
jgi:site-specific DNA-methyltransferase (adenine-specific)/adenine-specific DNA-methyltransferase